MVRRNDGFIVGGAGGRCKEEVGDGHSVCGPSSPAPDAQEIFVCMYISGHFGTSRVSESFFRMRQNATNCDTAEVHLCQGGSSQLTVYLCSQ